MPKLIPSPSPSSHPLANRKYLYGEQGGYCNG